MGLGVAVTIEPGGKLVDDLRFNAVAAKDRCSAFCRPNLEAELDQTAGEQWQLTLVHIVDRNEHIAAGGQAAIVRGELALGEGVREVAVEAHDFTCRTHFRSKQDVHGTANRRTEPLERQHGLLDGHLLAGVDVTAVALRQQQTVGALLGDGFTDHDAGRRLGQGHARCLRSERNGTRGSWVGFDNVQGVGHEGVLHVDEAAHTAALRDGVGAFTQAADLIVAERAWRQGACSVAGMHARFLDMLHDAADVEFLAVEQRIDINFDGVLQELVDKQRGGQTPGDDHIGLRLVERTADVLFELVIVVHDFHTAAAEHIARADQHRVPDVMCRFTGFVEA